MADPFDAAGFRRRVVIRPAPDQVTAALEDDYHCMAVTLHHDGKVIERVEPVMDRAPWTLCPGALAAVRQHFEGVALAELGSRGGKMQNCTHLHDLAMLAATHAADTMSVCYEIAVTDPVNGLVDAEIRRDGQTVLRMAHRANILIEPSATEGLSVFALRDWIGTLVGDAREAARLLQWGTILAHGRTTPMDRQNDASRMPPNCFNFQPERKFDTKRVGVILDFSSGATAPLDHFDGHHFTKRAQAIA